MSDSRPYDAIPLIDVPPNYPEILPEFLAATYDKYGPVFRIAPYGREEVILVGPEANRFVMTSDRLKFSHKIGWGEVFRVSDMFGEGLLSMDGPEHDRDRRTMNPAFTIQYMDRYLPIMNRAIRTALADWKQRDSIDLYAEARKLTFTIAAEALTGLQPGAEINEFFELYFGLLMTGGEDTEQWHENMRPFQRKLTALIGTKIRERREHPIDDLLGLMVQARDDQGRGLTDQQLYAHLNILLVAGHETSTSLLSWLIYLLIEHPAYRNRAIAEQDALLTPDQNPTLEDIKKMKLLDNALSEAERLYPPVANGPRGVVEDFDFGGYHIPAGTYALYSIAASHSIPSIFANPATFDPDRFAPPREEDKKTPYALVGFGGGPRICIGINFAQVELKAVASALLRNASLALLPGQQIRQAYYGPTGAPIDGIQLRVTDRHP